MGVYAEGHCIFLIDSYLIKNTSGGMRDDSVFSNTLENNRIVV